MTTPAVGTAPEKRPYVPAEADVPELTFRAVALGSIVVRRALSPLAEVTATAQRVSELPLDRGDVALGGRVAVDDERTEVGRLGTAFNRMLGHVASALSAREQSEHVGMPQLAAVVGVRARRTAATQIPRER